MSVVDRSKIVGVEEKADIIVDQPSPAQLAKYIKSGDRVSYIGKDNLYRSGGFVTRIAKDYESFGIKGGPYAWTLQRKNIRTLFVVSKK
jgi:hypothetical protein